MGFGFAAQRFGEVTVGVVVDPARFFGGGVSHRGAPLFLVVGMVSPRGSALEVDRPGVKRSGFWAHGAPYKGDYITRAGVVRVWRVGVWWVSLSGRAGWVLFSPPGNFTKLIDIRHVSW